MYFFFSPSANEVLDPDGEEGLHEFETRIPGDRFAKTRPYMAK